MTAADAEAVAVDGVRDAPFAHAPPNLLSANEVLQSSPWRANALGRWSKLCPQLRRKHSHLLDLLGPQQPPQGPRRRQREPCVGVNGVSVTHHRREIVHGREIGAFGGSAKPLLCQRSVVFNTEAEEVKITQL